MRTDQFLGMLHRLRLRPNSQRCAEALGLSLRQVQRITAGKAPVPRPVALLLIAYAKYGLPERLWDPDLSPEDAVVRAMESFNLSRGPR